MRVIVVGQGPFGEKVLKSLIKRGEDVVGVFSPPDKRGESMKEAAEESNISVFRPSLMKNPDVYDAYVKLRPALAVLAFVTDIIPESLIKVPTVGTICYHPSLLPRHRGASAVNWAIIMGDTRTGLTVFWVDKGIDTGPILLQKEVEIKPEDTAGSLYFNTLFPLGVEAMVEAVELIKKGEAPRIPQDVSRATYEPPCDDRVAVIDFEKPGRDVYNLVRGCDPQPGAYSTFKGRRVRLYETSFSGEPMEGSPGEVVSVEDRATRIALRGGILQIGKLRADKGEKLSPLEFAKAADLKVGDRFGQ